MTAQIDEDDRNEIIKKKDRKINLLEDKLAESESIANEQNEYAKKLDNLFKLWIIDDEEFVFKDSNKQDENLEELKSETSDM